MEDGYWDLFWRTGMPEFYLLRGQRENGGGLCRRLHRGEEEWRESGLL